MAYIILPLAAWNIFVFSLYGMDKWKASRRKWRISEKTLLFCAFFMGGVGALLGMIVFRHKTRHTRFKELVPRAVLLNAAIVAVVYYTLSKV